MLLGGACARLTVGQSSDAALHGADAAADTPVHRDVRTADGPGLGDGAATDVLPPDVGVDSSADSSTASVDSGADLSSPDFPLIPDSGPADAAPCTVLLTVGAGPHVAAQGTAVAQIAWADVTNLLPQQSGYAETGPMPDNARTASLETTDFRFSLPSSAVILGITVRWRRSLQGPGAPVFDDVVRLVWAGVPVGTNLANSTTWSSSPTWTSYGGPTELWGRNWTPAQINSSGFGCSLSAQTGAVGGNGARVYEAEIVVAYRTSRCGG